MQKKLMNVNEAATYLGIKKGTLYNMVNTKRIPFTKIGGKLLFNKDKLDMYIEENSFYPEVI